MSERPAFPILAITSGKGGVGKSTIAINIAQALQKAGHSVGLLDADLHGPSVPNLLNSVDCNRPSPTASLTPDIAKGLSYLSIGSFVDPLQPLIWRGPMVHKVLHKMLTKTQWNAIDYLVIDMPPGTGDAHITLAKTGWITGVIVVSTPQELSLIDVRKNVRMLQRMNVPILGLIENMAHYICPTCHSTSHIFGKGGAQAYCQEADLELLGSIPLDAEIQTLSEQGKTIYDQNAHALQLIFDPIARSTIEKIKTLRSTSALID